MKKLFIFFLLLSVLETRAQKWSQELGKTVLSLWKDSFMLEGDKVPKWRYDQGVILKGLEGVWLATGDGNWFNYIQKSMDYYVSDDGKIKGYRPDEYNIDHLNNGKVLLTLYQVTGKEKYRKAVELLRSQLRNHPRTNEGGFWHKKVYPGQMWLDGLYMGQPFYAAYANIFHEDSAFADITRQFVLIEKHARDPKTGLLYHGWDETRSQKWADKKTGLSANFWGRALGWYGMAMVDALDYFPKNHPGRDSIISILNRFCKAVISVQDKKTGLWFDVVDKPNAPKNYPEASASSMLVYTLAKGVRMGYIPASYLPPARKGYEGIVSKFISQKNGLVNLDGTVSVSGLGGNPYRDGSYEYYMSEPVITNDPKGIGAFINAANEMEMTSTNTIGKGQRVLLDYFFNNEWKADAKGAQVRYHYTWNDRSNSGFSVLGSLFNSYGVATDSLVTAPDAKTLKGASVYIVVDPDTEKETARPNYINETHANNIANWVKEGGTLLLLGNDAGNTDLKGLNVLASRFGIRFNEDNFNLVEGSKFEQGSVDVPSGNPIFSSPRHLYIKELATIQANSPAAPLVYKDGKTVFATAVYGKGVVIALGDPWIYNEYLDGRKLPASFDNFAAAKDLVTWIITKNSQKMKNLKAFVASALVSTAIVTHAQDSTAEKMLLYQRSVGGWPKHVNEVKVDYSKPIGEAEKAAIIDDANRNDATIDNNATSKEIRYLSKAYKATGNPDYLKAVERGVNYLLTMQYSNGGFPQFYPDSSSYRNEITYNDNAMINALNVLWDVSHGTNNLDIVSPSLKVRAEKAVQRGIDCILQTQVRRNGKLTSWCAQYNPRTLQPAKARAFELISLSGAESVAIVEFLMKIENPSKEVKQAITAAIEWFAAVGIKGYKYVDITGAPTPNGKDRVLVPEDGSIVWARFYDIDTDKPFFSGRDGVKKWAVSEIEHERRTGYAWYGTWPLKLLEKEFPEWAKKFGGKS